MRQLLVDKVSGNLVGLWLLIPEHLRLGTWDLLCGWTGQNALRCEPRLALQLVHEAALCTTGVRQKRALSQNGFELANGLPWLATDTAIHELLDQQKLLDHLQGATNFDLLVPMGGRKLGDLSGAEFTRHGSGYATLTRPYQPRRSEGGPFWQLVQRFGEREDDIWYKGFVSTTDREVVQMLCDEFPKRWHVEGFFNTDQALGWQRAGTQNLNIRYGQMTMALLAQASISQFRSRIGEPYSSWDASHLAESLFRGIEGDIRVRGETADRLRSHYEGLPSRLESEGLDPRIPWLYNFQLDFRFK